MSEGGLSEARLRRMHEVMSGYVERDAVPGLLALVERRGEVHAKEIGTTVLGGADPIRRDTIFRIASMSKPVTAVAAMTLVEGAGCASTIRWTLCCQNSPTARCCAPDSTAHWTTPCRQTAPSPYATS